MGDPNTNYAYFTAKNEEELGDYLLHEKFEEPLHLIEPITAFLGGKLKAPEKAKTTTYVKKKIRTYQSHGKKDSHELSIVNKDGEYYTTLWTTTPAKIKKALSAGIFFDADTLEPPNASRIAQIIACYGEYRKFALEDKLERDGLTSQKHREKEAIVDFAQQCLGHLIDLYNMVNAYDESITPQKNFALLIEKLEILSIEYSRVIAHGNVNVNLTNILAAGLEKLINEITAYQEICQAYVGQSVTKQKIKNLLKPYGVPGNPSRSLLHFIQDQIEIINATARKADNSISGLYNRGRLLSCTVKAEIARRKITEKVDYHNPASPEWSLWFGEDDDEKVVTLDFRKFGVGVKDPKELALQLTLLDTVETGTLPVKQKPEGNLKISWSNFDIFYSTRRTFARFIAGILGLIPDLIFAIYTIFVAPVARFFGFSWSDPSFYPSEKLEKWFTPSIISDPRTKYYKNNNLTEGLFDKTGPITYIPHRSLIHRVAKFLRSQLYKIICEPFYTLLYIVPKDWWSNLKKIYYDVTIGRREINDDRILELLRQKIMEDEESKMIFNTNRDRYIGAKRHYDEYRRLSSVKSIAPADVKSQTDVKSSYSSHVNAMSDKTEILSQRKYAVSPYPMDLDDPDDALSGAAHGIQIFLEVLIDEIYAKHPVGGMGFTYAALLGGLPILATQLPATFPILNSYMNNISIPIAKCLAGQANGFTAGFSTAFIHGKIAFATVDLLARGPTSLLVNLTKGVLENPIVTVIAGGLAIGIGYTIAYQLDISWLSGSMAGNTIGTFPLSDLVPELAVTSVKLGAIVAGGLIDISHKSSLAVKSKIELRRELICQELTYAYVKYLQTKRNNPEISEKDLTASDKDEIETSVEKYIQWMHDNYNRPEIIQLISDYQTALSQVSSEEGQREGERLRRDIRDGENFNEAARNKFRHRLIPELINRMNVNVLTDKDKSLIRHYVVQNYSDQPDYVNAVIGNLYRKKKLSPIMTSVREILNLPLLFVRGLLSLGFVRLFTGEGWKDLKNGLSGYLGLLTRAIGIVLKYTYLLASVVILSAISLPILIPTLMIGFFVEGIFRWLSCSSTKITNTYSFKLFKSVTHLFKKLFTIEKPWTRAIEYLTGSLRRKVKHKNLLLAHQSMIKKEKRAQSTPVEQRPTQHQALVVQPRLEVATEQKAVLTERKSGQMDKIVSKKEKETDVSFTTGLGVAFFMNTSKQETCDDKQIEREAEDKRGNCIVM